VSVARPAKAGAAETCADCRNIPNCRSDDSPLDSSLVRAVPDAKPQDPAGCRQRLKKIPVRYRLPRRRPRDIVSFSMPFPRGQRLPTAPAREQPGVAVFAAIRHAECFTPVFLEKHSHRVHGRVHSVQWWAESRQSGCDRVLDYAPRNAGRCDSDRRAVRNHGAARNGNRKRTRVRVACGGGIRPRGLGRQPIHGHFGLSVVGGEPNSPVVLQPACELRVCQRHFSRGPGLLAALKHGSPSAPYGQQPSARMAAGEHRTVRATRPDGCILIRAASLPVCPPECPAAGRGAHHTGPRTRLRKA